MRIWLPLLLALVLLVLIFTTGCCSARYHNEQIIKARIDEIEYAQSVARAVKDKKLTARDMILTLQDRKVSLDSAQANLEDSK